MHYRFAPLVCDTLRSLARCLTRAACAVADFGHLPNYFQGKTPCYIVFRLDTKNDQGFQWMLCSYVPDGSPVRQRMLYGSTRELLKRHLGSNYFASDLHGSSVVRRHSLAPVHHSNSPSRPLPLRSAQEDFTYAAFLQLKSKTIDAPLTEAEIVHKSEASMEVDYGHTREYVHSVSFPISAAGVTALRALSSGSNNLVQLVRSRSLWLSRALALSLSLSLSLSLWLSLSLSRHQS